MSHAAGSMKVRPKTPLGQEVASLGERIGARAIDAAIVGHGFGDEEHQANVAGLPRELMERARFNGADVAEQAPVVYSCMVRLDAEYFDERIPGCTQLSHLLV